MEKWFKPVLWSIAILGLTTFSTIGAGWIGSKFAASLLEALGQ